MYMYIITYDYQKHIKCLTQKMDSQTMMVSCVWTVDQILCERNSYDVTEILCTANHFFPTSKWFYI